MPYTNDQLSQVFVQMGGFVFLLIFLVIWSIVWKAMALWKSARAGSKGWFIVFLLINTAGILEIIYLLFVSKRAAPVVSDIKDLK